MNVKTSLYNISPLKGEVAASFSEQTEGLSIEVIRNIFPNIIRRYPHATKS